MKRFGLLIIIFFLIFTIIGGCTPNEHPIKHQITLYADEELITTININDGVVLTLEELVTPIKDGYYFFGWYEDATLESEYQSIVVKQAFSLYAKFLTYNELPEVIALSKIEIDVSTNKDISLPSQMDGYDISWVSSHPEIINHEGQYLYKGVEDVMIRLKATVLPSGYEKDFDILALAFDVEGALGEIADGITINQNVDSNIVLPTSFAHGTIGVWESSNPNVIASSGKVTLTTKQENIILTLTLRLSGVVKTIEFNLTTVPRPLTTNDVEYFIDRLSAQGYNKDDVIMTPAQVAAFNQTVLNGAATKVLDLAKLPITISKADISTMINSYTALTRYSAYHHTTNAILNTTDRNFILDNRNLSTIPDVVSVQYAVSTTHTVLRGYPTMHYGNNFAIDRFQETGFSAGIPMVVYHQSSDQEWYFVQMENYFGWVRAIDIGICSREEFMRFQEPYQFIVVLASILEINGEQIRMGYRIPYSEKTETEFLLEFPTRSTTGTLEIMGVQIAKNEQISDGYIDFTFENLLIQAYKYIGTPYSWGDKIVNGLDCSSTMASIYGCFGIRIGRNTSNQWATPTYGKTISTMSNAIIQTYQPGTLIYTSGHVLMYLGIDVHGVAWVLHNTSAGNICKIQTLNSYGTSAIRYVLEIRNMNG